MLDNIILKKRIRRGTCPCGKKASAIIRTELVCQRHFRKIQKDNVRLISSGKNIPKGVSKGLIKQLEEFYYEPIRFEAG